MPRIAQSVDGCRRFPYSHTHHCPLEFVVSIKIFVLLGSALLASAAFAQNGPSLGNVRNVDGLVTDTDGASVKSTTVGEQIKDGQRFVTSSSGKATLQLSNGCTITMQPNQAITINKNMTCRELIASMEPVGGAGQGLGRFVASGSPGAGAFAVGALILAGYGVHRGLDGNNDNNNNNQDLSGR